ncbi:hypothetical protein F4Y93_05945 [Candidatus Poribacteria bacterium]|nr:hypothetical protein [Candidatus Poribacteria bacterium]
MQNMSKSIPTKLSLPPKTHQKFLELAEHIGCVAADEKPMAATATRNIVRMVLEFYRDDDYMEKCTQEGIDALAYMKKIVRTVLDFYRDDDFTQKCEQEGIDALAFIKKCVRKEMKK